MKKIITLLLLLNICFIANAQLNKLEIGLTFGGSNYVGDINSAFNSNEDNAQWNQFESSFDFYNVNFMWGAMVRYNFNPRWVLNTSFSMSKLEGQDSYFNNPRNLSFYTDIKEFSSVIEFNFLDYQTGSRKHRIAPYIFVGIAGFHFNPKTDIVNPISQELESIFLRDFNTEGQGMPGYQEAYSRYCLAIPFGLGIKFSASEYISIGLQWGFRKTFTDYIDDISTRYVDHGTMIEWAGELGAAAADRTHELEGMEGRYNEHNLARGNEKNKDWYNFFGITITTKLSNGKGKCL
jgi:hypothetical protein